MRVNSLELFDFRNYENEKTEFSPGINLVTGENAQGKTNMLEGLYLLAAFRSFKGARARDMIRSGCEKSRVAASYTCVSRDFTVDVRLNSRGGREVSVNDIKRRRRADIEHPLCAVLFAPEHLELIKGAPSVRRSFLDFALCQISPGYSQAAADLKRVLAQKSALLKMIKNGEGSPLELDVWNERLAQVIPFIREQRKLFTESSKKSANGYHLEISGGKEELDLRYVPCEGTTDDVRGDLKRIMSREAAAGMCLYGPQRDILDIDINGADARLFASQGQSRSAVISLKLAECDAMERSSGESPVLLLDDILSELDASRREYITTHIGRMQTIMTDCTYQDPGSVNVIRISGGKVAR